MSKNKKMYGAQNETVFYDESITDETFGSPTEEETLEPTTRKGKLKGAILVNLREYPSKNSRVIDFVQKDTEFEIVDESSEWVRISYLERVGWIMAKYVEEVF